MRTSWLWIGGLSAAVACGIVGYTAGRARAAGIPTSQPMTYRGVLTDTMGVPLTGMKNIQLQVWNLATGGTNTCSVGPVPVTLAAGAFDVPLPDTCTTAVHAGADQWIEVFVDGSSLGRTKMGAVPFAVEADTASHAAGALNARIAGLENRLAHDTADTPQRICTGSTPIGTTAWDAYNATTVHVKVDTSACQFTTRPLYVSSLVGESNHYTATGGAAPYVTDANAKTQFDIYANAATNWTPADANTQKWHIEWVAIGN